MCRRLVEQAEQNVCRRKTPSVDAKKPRAQPLPPTLPAVISNVKPYKASEQRLGWQEIKISSRAAQVGKLYCVYWAPKARFTQFVRGHKSAASARASFYICSFGRVFLSSTPQRAPISSNGRGEVSFAAAAKRDSREKGEGKEKP